MIDQQHHARPSASNFTDIGKKKLRNTVMNSFTPSIKYDRHSSVIHETRACLTALRKEILHQI